MKFFRILVCFFIIISIPSFILADDFDENLLDEIPTITVSTDVTVEPKINSRRAIVFERNSKSVLYEKNSLEVCKMASTTKIMTSILILENCDLNSQVVVSSHAAGTQGSRLGLHTNDNISVSDLLYGLMLCSGNDAAVCLAEFAGGSVEGFAELMNAKAKELSLESTNFVTPHGLDSENHFTTAHDFAILTDYALNNPQFLQIVGTKYYTVSINGVSKSIHNTNELLGNLPTVYGVKTGFTSEAGRCLISAAKQNNLDIIVVVFGADTKNIRTNDSVTLINYIFSNYEGVDLGTLISNKYSDFKNYILPYMSVLKGASPLISKLDDSFPKFYPVKKDFLDSISFEINEFELSAPIMENQPIAEIVVYINNQKIFGTNIVSSAYISKKNSFDYFNFFILNYKNFYQI
ncbi:MAG: D-alanyl-D-alanine carboxypeptidase [Clostridia bacterium]|jgi:D-alanyl-D-alanine carboxypeptidase (penicillin-binding protein 5/6)|nr:D-alanyl-D-alanine carboxypeptidase [Clostridia bacterium]